MESAGAVFLPAAGYRSGTFVYGVGSCGSYWSSTPSREYDAYYMYFNSGDLGPQGGNYRDFGQSVRLVQDVK